MGQSYSLFFIHLVYLFYNDYIKDSMNYVQEIRYYICSIEADAREFERAARGHWKVENNLHWQLDFTFCDDKNSIMAKTGAKNLQIMKKIVMAILNTVKAGYKMSMERIRYELSLDYEKEAEKLLSMLDIEIIKNVLESKGKFILS